MPESDYKEDLHLIRSLLIVTSLQKKRDIQALRLIRKFRQPLDWEPLEDLMIKPDIWNYAVDNKGYDPKLVFCHPDILMYKPSTSLYYRGLCGLSIKIAKSYIGAIESLEKGSPKARLSKEKALKMARTYNLFICSIISNSTDWTLENGYRTIIATMGITLDGSMRNRIGDIAEERIRTLILEWLLDNNLISEPVLTREQIDDDIPRSCILSNGVIMQFSSEPDISFTRDGQLLAILEIKGGIDPAGALERYGAATKSFQHAIGVSPRCKNIYLGAVFTPELKRRIDEDRLVEKTFNIIEILDNSQTREQFFNELFHHTLRVV
jgi:hypothetical protein